jgi:hypothetical protein
VFSQQKVIIQISELDRFFLLVACFLKPALLRYDVLSKSAKKIDLVNKAS